MPALLMPKHSWNLQKKAEKPTKQVCALLRPPAA